MKQLILSLITALTLIFASGCSTIPDAGKVLLGSAYLVQTSEVRDLMLDYLPSDAEARIARDLQFLDTVYARLQELDSGTSIAMLALDFPDVFDRVGESFAAIRQEVRDYSAESGIAIPVRLSMYADGVVPAYKEIRRAMEADEKAVKAVEMIRLLKPIVIAATV